MNEHLPDGADQEADVGATVGTGGGSETDRAAGGSPFPRLRGAEVWIAVAFVAAVFAGFGLAACYAAGGQPQVEGVVSHGARWARSRCGDRPTRRSRRRPPAR